jgi:O-6-methylguanine DNA methyltransferase
MSLSKNEPGKLLRARGLRSTPQRRAILGVFDGAGGEHLSADEVYARAARSLPDLSRGTVYATLAEFTETGLLSAFGSPEPVRYETNISEHAHFRCRLCMRIFDLSLHSEAPVPIKTSGFRVERIDIRAEGICEQCSDYQRGLKTGARDIARSGSVALPSSSGTATAEIDSPMGMLLVSATGAGVVRMAFPEHADAERLLSLSRRRGTASARQQLQAAAAGLERYFDGRQLDAPWEIDWSAIDPRIGSALRATLEIPYGEHRSYSELDLVPGHRARELGWIFGSNPIPIITPCHRVIRGLETPSAYVGGTGRRRWLDQHERQHTRGAGT